MARYDVAKVRELEDKLGKLIIEIEIVKAKGNETAQKYETLVLTIADLVGNKFDLKKDEIKQLGVSYNELCNELITIADKLAELKKQFSETKVEMLNTRFPFLKDVN